MNAKLQRMKNGKKGITPVIATIILIAVTLVLALVVGAYTFGLFGSNVKQVTLTSGNLFAGNLQTNSSLIPAGASYISFSLNNPGAATTITGFTLTGSSLTAAVTAYVCTTNSTATSCLGVAPSTTGAGPVKLGPGQVTTGITLYFGDGSAADSTTSGQTYNYVISLQNGQSVSGSFIAQ